MSDEPREFKVSVPAAGGDETVSAREYPAASPALSAVLILAHGAGAGHDSAFLVTFARALAARGLATVTFNFPYMERRRRVADKPPALEACWLAVARTVRATAGKMPLFIGGKSMGGRIASMVAASPEAAALGLGGLVFLGYPLHPPGRTSQLRVSHWSAVRVPALFVQGSRDAFGSVEKLREHLPSLGARAELMVVDGGDHSFKVVRAPGPRQDAVYVEVQDAIVDWVRRTK